MKIESMTTKELRAEYKRVYGKAVNSNNKPWLVKKLTEASKKSQTKEQTDSKRVSVKTKAKTPDKRLPPVGTKLTRSCKGKTITCTVMDDGIKYGGKTYASLSAVAYAATGTVWNGYRFFGLGRDETS